MAKFDIASVNRIIDRLIEITTNPRHRFLLLAFSRHRYLEMAGRYEEIFAPEMMVEHPVYHMQAIGITVKLDGAEAVRGLYSMWASTNQAVFESEQEQVAVSDNYVFSVATARQQVLGNSLIANGIDVDDENAYYSYRAHGVQQIWPYDDRGRLVGEDVWEPEPGSAEIIKLDPTDVMTTEEARNILKPLIKPLPSYDDTVPGRG